MVRKAKETPLEKLRRNPEIHKVKRFLSYSVTLDVRNGYTDCSAVCKYTGETLKKAYPRCPTSAKQAFCREFQYLTL